MNMNKKTLIKLALFLPMMMALASCSSMGGMQALQANQSQQVHKISHKKTSKHYPQQHTKQTSVPKSKPAHVVEQKPVQQSKEQSVVIIKTKIPPKSTQIEQKVIITPAKVTPRSAHIMLSNPIVGQLWLLPVHGIDMKAHKYKKANERLVVKNLDRMDTTTGNYHFVQVSRWNGMHMDKAFVNARTASMLTLIGLGLLENGYIETNFGSYIIIFAGKGILIDLPASQYEMVSHKAKHSKPRKKHSFHQIKHSHVKVVNFNPDDFYILGSKVVDVVSLASADQVKPAHKVTSNRITKTKAYCHIKHHSLNTPEDMVASKYRFSQKQ